MCPTKTKMLAASLFSREQVLGIPIHKKYHVYYLIATIVSCWYQVEQLQWLPIDCLLVLLGYDAIALAYRDFNAMGDVNGTVANLLTNYTGPVVI